MTGYVHSIESLAARDGEGLRCAVFLGGCPLRCIYCHNPDTWEKVGREYTAEELCQKLLRLKPYFGEKGGVTFSGGEPLLQADFILETVPILQGRGISYVIDTSGAMPLSSSVKAVLANASQVLLDLKFWDDVSYRQYTGIGIEGTMNTLSFLNEIGKKTVLRTVIVPGINDTVDALERYLSIVKSFPFVKEYELLSFHTMGFFKYDELGIQNPLAGTRALAEERLCELNEYVKKRM